MFSKFELTNKGVELLNRVIAEQKILKFTKFQIGKGDFSGDKKTLTQLVSKIDEFNVSQTNVLADGITNIKGFYDNRNLSVASKLTEIGIMAQLGDDSLTEVLFSYSNQPSAEAETIPAKESYFSRTFSVMNRTDNVTSVTFDLTIRQDKYNFGTLAEMKAADYLDVGDKVTLWGNAALGDSSFKMYIITDQTQPIQLNNKLYAKEYFKIVNDLTTGGVDKALSGEMGKKLNTDKQNKTDNSLKTKEKQIVPAINELNTNFNGTKFYTSLTQLGFENDSSAISKLTLKNVVDAMSYRGVAIIPVSQDFYFIGTEPLNGIFYIIKLNESRGTAILYPSGFENANKMMVYAIRPASDVYRPRTILNDSEPLFLGNAGISKVIYIQDVGTKTKGQGYIDKATGRLYKCKETNKDVSVTTNFEPADNISNSNIADEVTLINDTETTTGEIYSYTIPSGYKYLNIYAGFNATATFFGRVQISKLTDSLNYIFVENHSVNDYMSATLSKTQIKIGNKRVEGDDSFKYMRIVASNV